MFTFEVSYEAATGEYLFNGAPTPDTTSNWEIVSWTGSQVVASGYYSSYDIIIKDKVTGKTYQVKIKVDSNTGQVSQN